MKKKSNYTIEYSYGFDSNNPYTTYEEEPKESPILIRILASPIFFGILIAISILANSFLYLEIEGRYILTSASLYNEMIGVIALSTFLLFIYLALNSWAASKYPDIAKSMLKHLKKNKYALLLNLKKFEKAGFSAGKKRAILFIILALIALCFYGYTLLSDVLNPSYVSADNIVLKSGTFDFQGQKYAWSDVKNIGFKIDLEEKKSEFRTEYIPVLDCIFIMKNNMAITFTDQSHYVRHFKDIKSLIDANKIQAVSLPMSDNTKAYLAEERFKGGLENTLSTIDYIYETYPLYQQ